MNLLSMITDDITEILIRIMEFTQSRQKVLTRNIVSIRQQDYEPRDLSVNEFSQSLNIALEEYTRNRRLVLADTKSIKYGVDGTLKALPIVDEQGRELLMRSTDEYLEFQMNKLLENSLNQRIAAELLRQRGMSGI